MCHVNEIFLHLDEMRVQFGDNDAVMLKVTNLIKGQIGNAVVYEKSDKLFSDHVSFYTDPHKY